MPRLIRNAHVVDDAYMVLRDARTLDDVPEGVPVLVPLALWLSARDVLLTRGNAGVWLAPADDPAALARDVTRLSVIAVDFPAFADGRGYSTARLLRERYGYKGEIRAVGDVLREQARHMVRCGFDAFVPSDGSKAPDWAHKVRGFRHVYQRAADGRAPAFVEREGA